MDEVLFCCKWCKHLNLLIGIYKDYLVNTLKIRKEEY